jgi:hypothetical protein
MEDLKFYVLTKKVTIDPFKQGGLSKEEINIDQLKSDTFANTQEALRFDKYKIDKDSIKTEVINGELYVVMLAFYDSTAR